MPIKRNLPLTTEAHPKTLAWKERMAVKRGIKVTYFDGRGRAEVLRFALGGAGIHFENVLIKDRKTMEDILASD